MYFLWKNAGECAINSQQKNQRVSLDRDIVGTFRIKRPIQKLSINSREALNQRVRGSSPRACTRPKGMKAIKNGVKPRFAPYFIAVIRGVKGQVSVISSHYLSRSSYNGIQRVTAAQFTGRPNASRVCQYGTITRPKNSLYRWYSLRGALKGQKIHFVAGTV